MPISPIAFADNMEQHWTQTLGNETSPALKAVWKQMAHVFGRSILDHDKPEDTQWSVLQPPTGTGKSQGLALYSAMLAESNRETSEEPVGVLIVVRLKTQADHLADTINKHAGFPCAAARHGDSRMTPEEMRGTDVLIITHKAYELAVDEVNRNTEAQWTNVSDWDHGPRKLVVIDEALDIVNHSQIDLDSLRQVIGMIPYEVEQDHPKQMEALKHLQAVLEGVASCVGAEKQAGKQIADRVAWSGSTVFPQEYSLLHLRRALRKQEWDRKVFRRHSTDERARISHQVDTTLAAVQSVFDTWAYYSRKGKRDTLNTSHLIIPADLKGPVVLDATASTNLLWTLLEDRVKVCPIPDGSRSYGNVRVHVKRVGGVGKTTMKQKGEKRIGSIMADLSNRLGPDNKAFVCSHLGTEHHVAGFVDAVPFDLSCGHWNAVDGRNDWQDHDTAVIIGLPYRDRVWSTNTFFAFQGLQPDDWMQDDASRTFAGHGDIRKELEIRQIGVQLVQAINRVQCRRVIDGRGNCPETDVFVLLPTDKTGDRLIDTLKKEMPGVKIAEWDLRFDEKRLPRKGSLSLALLTYLQNALPGEYSASHLKETLKISQGAWKELTKQLRDEASSLSRCLIEQDIRYETKGRGASLRSYVVKPT